MFQSPNRAWAALMILTACMAITACGKEKLPPEKAEYQRGTPLNQTKLSCGIFPPEIISTIAQSSLSELEQSLSLQDHQSKDGAAVSDLNLFTCEIFRLNGEVFSGEALSDRIISIRIGSLDGETSPEGKVELERYLYVAKNPDRVSLPEGLGSGFFVEGAGAYATYSCGGLPGGVYVQVSYFDFSVKGKLQDAFPLLKAIDTEVRSQVACR